MKNTLILSALIAVFASCSPAKEQATLAVVPHPNEVTVQEGSFDAANASVYYDEALDERSKAIVKRFAEQLFLVSESNGTLEEGSSKSGIVFELDNKLAHEEYTLKISENKVTVKASGLNGFNYAIQTIKQMLPVEVFGNVPAADKDWTLPCVKIQDKPRFSYRGLHFDVSRHFFTMDEVKKYIDIMEVHKLNTLHWHLTDDQGWRLEIKKYPRLTEVGSIRNKTIVGHLFESKTFDNVRYGEGCYYTQEEVKEILEYAAARGITVIPEIDLPGHMLAALAAYPELGCTGGPYEVWGMWGVADDVLCVGKENTMKFLEDVLAEVCELFPAEYVHIGGDECPKVRWEACPHCQAKIAELGLKDDDRYKAEHYLQGYVTARMEEFLAQKGKKLIGWDEILEGEIAPNATVMSWRGTEGGIEAMTHGHDVIMTPNTHCYLDYYQSRRIQDEPFAIGGFVNVEKVYSFEPYTPEMTPEQRAHILGVQANLWTEYIKTPEHLEYMLLPRMSALSEVQWCAPEKKDYGRFLDKMSSMVKIYQKLGYNFARHIFEVQPVIGINVDNACPEVRLATQGDAPMYYTLDGSEPTASSTLYTEPVCVRDGEVFKAIVVREDIPTHMYSQSFPRHKAMGKAITMNTEPSELYAAGLPQSLVNGVLNEDQDAAAGEWMAWRGKPVEVVIDMNGESYSTLSVRTFVSKWEDMYAPLGLEAYVSEDGHTFEPIAAEEYPIEEETVPDGIKKYDLEFPETSARYLKVVVKTVPALPEWSERTGKPAYLFLDEIKVE